MIARPAFPADAAMPARRVRVLRLAAPDETLARRGAILLEDALRTASLPDGDGGRLVIVRSLNLGRIHGDWSPGSVALVLEQRWRELAAGAVYAASPSAVSQPAVYFRDRAEAVTLLALRVARGADVSAWFWPLAVPGWQPGLSGSAASRRVLAATLALPTTIAAILGLLETLHDAGALSPFLEALRAADGPVLLAACGWERGESERAVAAGVASGRSDESDRTAAPGINSGWRDELARAVNRWGADDARSVWLATAILTLAAPGRLLDPRLADQGARLARAITPMAPPSASHTSERLQAADTPPEPVKSGDRRELSPPAGEAKSQMSRPEARFVVQSPAEAPGAGDLAGTSRGSRTTPATADTQPAGDAALVSSAPDTAPGLEQHTRFAGLFLLLPLLTRLDIAGLIESHPPLAELDLPSRILCDTARRLRIPATDPVRAALRPIARWRGACPFVAPAAWERLAEQPQLEPDHTTARRSEVAILLDAWAVAMRRWLAAYAGIRLGELIRRPGFVAATRTHLDVVFPLHSADIRIRRAGLDLDPGWLPWFGRVVLYHYDDRMPFESAHA